MHVCVCIYVCVLTQFENSFSKFVACLAAIPKQSNRATCKQEISYAHKSMQQKVD